MKVSLLKRVSPIFFLLLLFSAAGVHSQEVGPLPPFLPQGPAAPYTVEELTEAAFTGNKELKQLEVETEKNRIDLQSAKAGRFPTIGGEIRLSHIANPIGPVSVTAGQFGAYPVAGQEDVLIPPQDVRIYDGMEPMLYQFVVTLEQPIFTWGKINNSISLYEKVLETGRINTAKKKKEIGTALRIYVYSLHYLREMEKILAQQRETADRLVFISEKGYENGFIPYADLLQARMESQKINLGEYEIQNQKENILLNLRHTTGLEIDGYEQIDFSKIDLNLANYPPLDKEEMIAHAKKNNMDISLLSAFNKVANYKYEIAKGKSYLKPDIGLRLELSYGGPRFPFIEPDWYGQDDYNLVSTIAFVTTFFDGGKLRSEIEMGQADARSSSYQLEKGKQEIEKFISETLLKLELYRNNIEYYKLKIESRKEQVSLKKAQYDAGAGQESEYLRELILEYSDRTSLLQEELNFFTSYFTLMNVVFGE